MSAATSEKVEWWTTIGVITIADGEFLQFTVIHQSAAENTIAGNLISGLCSDFLVQTSPSGYNTRSLFAEWMSWLVNKVDAKKGNAFFLFIDGHDSHWDAQMHEMARENYIFCIFLRANASITGQPNDNGFNATFKAAYSLQFSLWLRSHGRTTPLTKTYQNEIVSAAYLQLKNKSKINGIIINAFKKTRCFPLVLC